MRQGTRVIIMAKKKSDVLQQELFRKQELIKSKNAFVLQRTGVLNANLSEAIAKHSRLSDEKNILEKKIELLNNDICDMKKMLLENRNNLCTVEEEIKAVSKKKGK